MTLGSTISMLSAQTNLDDRGSEILAAATVLQDSTGRDRLGVLRAMCTSWGVQRREKTSGKWKDRSAATLQDLLTNAVCSATTQYLAAPPDNTGPEQRGAAEHELTVSSLTASTGREIMSLA